MKILFFLIVLLVAPFQAQRTSVDQEEGEPVTLTIKREDARRYLNGGCIPRLLAFTQDDDTVRIIVRMRNGDTRNAQEWTAALVNALGLVPPQHSIHEDRPIPEGWHHLTYYPETRSRLIGLNTPLVKFCE